MTREQFKTAMDTLKAQGYEERGAVMCTRPDMCGVHFVNPKTGDAFLLNKFTFNTVKA